MKKLLTVAFIFMFAFSFLNAQESTFSEGDKVINLGVGFGSLLYTGTGYSTTVPPVSASFEYGIMDNVLEKGSIGVGGYVGYTAARWESIWSGYVWGYEYSSFILGARGSFHYPLVDKLDTYAGMMLGYNTVKVSEFGTYTPGTVSSSGSGVAWSMYFGGRYYFSPNFAVFTELGYGIAYLNLGIALKI